MRVRKMVNGDMSFGAGSLNYFINDPAGVGQVIGTRLGLHKGDWFLDTSDGTNWDGEILGYHTESSRNAEVRNRITGTVGVNQILSFSASVDHNRKYNLAAQVETQYSVTPIPVQGTF